jgi:hypothetical protein
MTWQKSYHKQNCTLWISLPRKPMLETHDTKPMAEMSLWLCSLEQLQLQAHQRSQL